MHSRDQASRQFAISRGLEALGALDAEWDALAARASTPFLLREWLTAWCEAFATAELMVATLREPAGTLVAAAVMCRRRGGLGTPANEHTGDWDATAVDDAARKMLWEGIAALGHRQLRLERLRGGSRATAIAGEALASAGYRTLLRTQTASPYLEFPTTWQELLASRSANLRQQWRRRRRALERGGELALRVTTGGDEFERDLDTFFALEASGWKGRQETAVASDPRTMHLYRSFARAAFQRGVLRLYLLELDGRALAADLGCAVGGIGFLIKTGFDDAEARLAPGLVLRGEVLRASIEEGLTGYDFLGGPDAYKVRWTDDLRPRVEMWGYRGVAGVGFGAYHHAVRPALTRTLRGIRKARKRGDA
ncbi:MAG: GNAT family N-acetyltransferase [Solirubrobacteraceae bacterium]